MNIESNETQQLLTAEHCITQKLKEKKKKKVKFSMKEYIELLWNLFSKVYIGIYFNSIC